VVSTKPHLEREGVPEGRMQRRASEEGIVMAAEGGSINEAPVLGLHVCRQVCHDRRLSGPHGVEVERNRHDLGGSRAEFVRHEATHRGSGQTLVRTRWPVQHHLRNCYHVRGQAPIAPWVDEPLSESGVSPFDPQRSSHHLWCEHVLIAKTTIAWQACWERNILGARVPSHTGTLEQP